MVGQHGGDLAEHPAVAVDEAHQLVDLAVVLVEPAVVVFEPAVDLIEAAIVVLQLAAVPGHHPGHFGQQLIDRRDVGAVALADRGIIRGIAKSSTRH